MFVSSINTTGDALAKSLVETYWSSDGSPGLQQIVLRLPGAMRFMKYASAAMVALLGSQTRADSTYSPARPPAVPLAVRSPYLNVWLNSPENGGNATLPGTWPRFWTTGIKGWQGFIKVDGENYNWMGGHPGASNVDQVSVDYTSTRSIFNMSVAGKVSMNIEFLSPVYPDDLRRQSIPFSYLNVAVRSLDGAPHSVQVYADVSGEFASGDSNDVVQWETSSANGIRSHKFYKQNQTEFGENDDNAVWGNWYWSAADTPGMTYEIGADTDVRGQFFAEGRLNNEVDSQFRAINERWPVFAFSRDLGKVKSNAVSTLFTIGIAQKNSIEFTGQADQPQAVPSLWTSYFSEKDLVTFFFQDYNDARHASNRLDTRIQRDSVAAGGQDYATMTTLVVRQVFGALAYSGTADKPLIFLKEISSNSDIQTVDVIFPAFPILLYLNPNLLKYLLDPLLINGRYHYPNSYAQHDLGRFPRANGHPKGDDEAMPLEECGNMIILMLAYAQRKNDDQYLADNWDLIVKWAQYLIEDSKIPAQQLSTDDFAGHLANKTKRTYGIRGYFHSRANFQHDASQQDSLRKADPTTHAVRSIIGTHDQEAQKGGRDTRHIPQRVVPPLCALRGAVVLGFEDGDPVRGDVGVGHVAWLGGGGDGRRDGGGDGHG
ncbi:hypothetical protein E4U53_006048 [Claviceps sorghi]|nr:hypothetical protein E4U53_006048 [Claviceps sorghi]